MKRMCKEIFQTVLETVNAIMSIPIITEDDNFLLKMATLRKGGKS